MNWNEYEKQFDDVLDGTNTNAPYDKEIYQEYVKLNQSRSNRWIKKNPISDEMKAVIEGIETPQKWSLRSEAWCGDAAHSSPIIKLLTDLSDKIEFEVQLRDSDSEIDNYLTNGGKSIPKLVVRDEHGKDLFSWGPRPAKAQELVMELKMSDLSIQGKNTQIQQWYNKDKAISIQQELIELLSKK
jgi:hypothetical protein